MPIQISCPSCQRQLRVPDELMGQMVKCPSCQNTFTATVEESPPPRQERVREEVPPPPTRAERDRDDEPRRRSRDDDDFDDRPRRRREGMEPDRGTLILVLGILSLVGLSIFTGIPAWIMGNADMAKIRNGTMNPAGESNTNIGRILGMISTILFIVGLLPLGLCCCLGGLGGMAGH